MAFLLSITLCESLLEPRDASSYLYSSGDPYETSCAVGKLKPAAWEPMDGAEHALPSHVCWCINNRDNCTPNDPSNSNFSGASRKKPAMH